MSFGSLLAGSWSVRECVRLDVDLGDAALSSPISTIHTPHHHMRLLPTWSSIFDPISLIHRASEHLLPPHCNRPRTFGARGARGVCYLGSRIDNQRRPWKPRTNRRLSSYCRQLLDLDIGLSYTFTIQCRRPFRMNSSSLRYPRCNKMLSSSRIMSSSQVYPNARQASAITLRVVEKVKRSPWHSIPYPCP